MLVMNNFSRLLSDTMRLQENTVRENATADLSCQSLCVLFYFLQLGNSLVMVTCQNFKPLLYFVQQYLS